MARRCRPVALTLVLAVLLVACGGGGEVRWRDLRLTLPDGWSVFEERDDLLSIANAPLGEEADPQEPPEGDVLAVSFTHAPAASPETWRSYIAGLDGAELEVDRDVEVGGVPARQLIYTSSSSGTDTREMVVVIPGRQVEVLAQPVPFPGDTGAQESFDAALPVFEALFAEASWGAPVDGPGSTGG
ncbi:hypothetical protein FTX61_17740 [Nitriliruptoraceae bacterium ZYF776]|nr:hypothetical protein [Profundirhabdus halotolerans]